MSTAPVSWRDVLAASAAGITTVTAAATSPVAGGHPTSARMPKSRTVTPPDTVIDQPSHSRPLRAGPELRTYRASDAEPPTRNARTISTAAGHAG